MTLTLFQQIRRNNQKSIFLVFVFFIFVGILGAFFGIYMGNVWIGVIFSSIFALIYTLIVFNSGGSMILAMTGARPVTKQEYPHLYHSVEGIALAAGIPTPKAYVIDDTALNAFATGKNPKEASIVVTTGLLAKLNRQELEGVIAHEMSHIKNYDIRIMMLAAVLVGVVTLISDFMLRSFLWGGHRRDKGQVNLPIIIIGLLLAILAPLVAYMIKLGISRQREYLADASGAQLTRYPPGLASALRKIKGDPDPLVDRANKATAHLFISTPFRKKSGWLNGLFSTHPPIDDRINRLERM